MPHMQALADEPLLLVEPCGRQPHQIQWLHRCVRVRYVEQQCKLLSQMAAALTRAIFLCWHLSFEKVLDQSVFMHFGSNDNYVVHAQAASFPHRLF